MDAKGEAAGTKQGVLWKQGSSVLPVLLAFSPKLPAVTCLCVPASRDTLLSMLIFMPGQIPFCAQIIWGHGGRRITHCQPA